MSLAELKDMIDINKTPLGAAALHFPIRFKR
jgi:hypothetical protein